jgi:hypothetical protein
MRYQIHRIDTFTFAVIDTTTGNTHFRGPMQAAANECSRLNVAAMTVTTSPRKAARLRQIAERKEAGV